ncbi:MAG: PilZ domain-containing protein [Leptospiraceae bacterium]|nr:PilZ domain-containing protein [Leptospiraceae bacterium]MCB1303730.1 PilZ domain-containing protein [Leptospiraceae bacterium]
MSEEVKKVNDPEQLRQICSKIFTRLPVHIKDQTTVEPVRVLGYEVPLLHVEHNRPDADIRVLIVNHDQHLMLLECKVQTREAPGKELLHPVRLHLKRKIRKQKRVSLAADSRKLVVDDLITVRSIPEALGKVDEKQDSPFKEAGVALKKIAENARLSIRKSFRLDNRMRAISAREVPIFIPDRTSGRMPDFPVLSMDEYKKILTYESNADRILSEVSIPVLFKGVHMIGLATVISNEPMDDSHYNAVKSIVTNLEKEVLERTIVPENPEHCPVVDINTGGAGILHPHNPSVMKGFLPGEEVTFDLHFPGEKTYTIIGSIRNIKSLERAHRIGLEFENLRQEVRSDLEDFLQQV